MSTRNNAVRHRYAALTLLVCLLGLVSVTFANETTSTEPDLFDLSLEDLMDIEVTSVSKKEERLFDAAAAIYVVTNEDIRRSGATTLPEILRMVPGLQVARINSNSWAVTSRGFQSQFANKLLVLIDGRSVYNSQYSGVFWDVQEVMPEDVDRIEVIRGPGGTLWGANAVNGIINIITKEAKDTPGGLVTMGTGDEEEGFGAIRYGGQIGETAHFRTYAKYFDHDGTATNAAMAPPGPGPPPGPGAANDDLGDDWNAFQVGFRTDWDKTDNDRFTFQGDVYDGQVDQSAARMSFPTAFDRHIAETTDLSGANLIGRWTHTFSETSDMIWQVYYDNVRRIESNTQQADDTYDLDFQHRFALDDRQEIVWGLGYRHNRNTIDSNSVVTFDPETRRSDLVSSFIQDQINLVPDWLCLTLGSKFEHNSYTGFEIQPSGRLAWTPDEENTVWAAISRAVRTPSRTERDLRVDTGGGPTPGLTIRGSDDFVSETVLAYELGYRVKPSDTLSFDIATFYNVYDDLTTTESTGAPGDPNTIIVYDNNLSGETYGVELAANWNPTEAWKLVAGYTFTQMQLHLDDSGGDPPQEQEEGSSPHNQFRLSSYLDLPQGLQIDTTLYYVDNLPALNIPSYFRLDARLGWHITDDLELSLVGQNLLDGRHAEYSNQKGAPDANGEIERSFYIKLTYRF